jgi:hypothetical protein
MQEKLILPRPLSPDLRERMLEVNFIPFVINTEIYKTKYKENL